MTDIGQYALLIAFMVAAYSAWAAMLGARTNRDELVRSAERGAYTLFILLTLAMLALSYAFATRDFQVRYVAEYSSRNLPLFYSLSAVWAGQAGSLLFWGWLLAIFTAIVAYQNRNQNREYMPYVLFTTSVTTFFFLILVIFATNPFERLPFRPQDGNGLNPLLQNPAMIFHPPSLYVGFVGFTIPFAFAMAALMSGQLDSQWIKSIRRWTLFSWLFLTIGNLLGAQWAYVELGWGGYWAWDPVENASFMPWLTSTAFLHSIMIQERKGMLKIWNMVLIIITFTLTIFGTFITRSGIISSVHSFGVSNLGPLFLIFLGLIIIGTLLLLIKRWSGLKSETKLDSLISRESSFLLNNIIFLVMTIAVFWGTVFPVISEIFKGTQMTVGQPYFNRINVPLGLALLLLTGLCSLIAWRKATLRNLIRNFLYPALIAMIGGGLLLVLGIRHVSALLSFGLSIFVITTMAWEVFRGIGARRKMMQEKWLTALRNLIGKNRRRYGGYVVHLGVVMLILSITGSSAFQVEKQATLSPGQSMKTGSYELRYEELTTNSTANKFVVVANLSVFKNGQKIGEVAPERNFYPGSGSNDQKQTSEVAIRSTLKEDLYVILAAYSRDQTATFQVFVNPLVVWMWIGGGVMTLGLMVVIWPVRKQKRAFQPVSQNKS